MAAAWEEMIANPRWVVAHDRAQGLVCVRRTSVPLSDLEMIDRDFAELGATLQKLASTSGRLLLDLRAAPMRNDPAFEGKILPAQAKLRESYKRTAVLVSTAVGRLQVSRTQREQGRRAEGVFLDEAEALAWLSE